MFSSLRGMNESAKDESLLELHLRVFLSSISAESCSDRVQSSRRGSYRTPVSGISGTDVCTTRHAKIFFCQVKTVVLSHSITLKTRK